MGGRGKVSKNRCNKYFRRLVRGSKAASALETFVSPWSRTEENHSNGSYDFDLHNKQQGRLLWLEWGTTVVHRWLTDWTAKAQCSANSIGSSATMQTPNCNSLSETDNVSSKIKFSGAIIELQRDKQGYKLQSAPKMCSVSSNGRFVFALGQSDDKYVVSALCICPLISCLSAELAFNHSRFSFPVPRQPNLYLLFEFIQESLT